MFSRADSRLDDTNEYRYFSNKFNTEVKDLNSSNELTLANARETAPVYIRTRRTSAALTSGRESMQRICLRFLCPDLSADAGLLQQVLLYLGSLDGSSLVEVDVDVLPEAGRVVVPDRLGVPERCRCRIRNSGFIVLMWC